jgi:hypothetical protein
VPRPKDDAEVKARKLRSAQTMLYQERILRAEMEKIAESAVNALQGVKNGQIEEALASLADARAGYVRAASAADARGRAAEGGDGHRAGAEARGEG